MPSQPSREWEILEQTLLAAGAEIMQRYDSFDRIEDAPAEISTDADRASQDLIFERLKSAFPNDRLCGEERTDALLVELASHKTSPRIWIVDPIDGTRGFARKNGEFSIMIGLVEQGSVILGGVYEPVLGRLTMANRQEKLCVIGQGDHTWKTAMVRPTFRMEDAIIAMSRSRKNDAEQRLLEILGARQSIKSYSAGIKLAQVARGEADVYIGDYPVMHDWDVCAGAILVELAGGKVTDLEGHPLRFGVPPFKQQNGLVATNGALHEPVLAAVGSRPAGLY
jgi:3'(2'), 5'-bisphosphate nucleotidase